jgi:hypothetical protein
LTKRLRRQISRKNLARNALVGQFVALDCDVKITPAAQLRLRLIVAKDKRALRRIGKAIGLTIYRRTEGLVAPLSEEWVKVARDGTERSRMVYDRRYFAAMLLSKKHANTELVAHECGHAAIFYSRRVKSNKWQGRVPPDDPAGEAICYPLGHIMRAVTSALYRHGVWT